MTTGLPDTVYGQPNTELVMQSETADNIAWARYATPAAGADGDAPALSPSTSSRIEFRDLATPVPLHAAIREANALLGAEDWDSRVVGSGAGSGKSGNKHHNSGDKGNGNGGDGAPPTQRRRLLVMTGRSRRLAVEDHSGELRGLMEEYGHVGSDVRKTVGDVATAFVVAGVGGVGGIVVVQAAVGV